MTKDEMQKALASFMEAQGQATRAKAIRLGCINPADRQWHDGANAAISALADGGETIAPAERDDPAEVAAGRIGEIDLNIVGEPFVQLCRNIIRAAYAEQTAELESLRQVLQPFVDYALRLDKTKSGC